MSHEYLTQVLQGQLLSTSEARTLQNTRAGLETLLRNAFGPSPRIYYGGSYGKNTIIRSSYDLDIIIYFPHTTSTSLKDLYGGVYNVLKQGGLIVKPKTVAIRLPYEGGFHIDVVPGRAQDAQFRYATLYRNPDSTLQTSLKVHIDAVSRPGMREVVRLVKLWRLRHSLPWETFALEIVVSRALAGKPITNLANATIAVWKFIVEELASARLMDPANSNNEISMSPADRERVVRAAVSSLAANAWQDVLW